MEAMRGDDKLQGLSRELMSRHLVPGFRVAEAFAMRGLDEMGKPGLFAAVLLAPGPAPDFDSLTEFRLALTQRLRQVDTQLSAWPIVVQGAPEVIDGDEIPGGPEYFQQVKRELVERQQRLASALRAPSMSAAPMLETPVVAAKSNGRRPTVKAARPAKAVKHAHKPKRPTVKATRPAKAARARR